MVGLIRRKRNVICVDFVSWFRCLRCCPGLAAYDKGVKISKMTKVAVMGCQEYGLIYMC